MGSQQKKSTSQKIFDLINPTPVTYDPDDDLDAETAAKVVDNYDEEISEEDKELTKFKKNIDFLEEQDDRYTGEKISRKVLRGDSDSEEQQLSEQDDDSSDELQKSDHSYSHSEQLQSDDGLSSKSDDSDGSDDTSGDINEALASVELSDSVEEGESSFQHISKQNTEADVEKGNAVKNQLSLWDNLLECRIQLQKCLVTANKLPQHNMFDEFKVEGGTDFKALAAKSMKCTRTLLDKLVNLRETLLSSYSETKYLAQSYHNGTKATFNQEMDEEIPSDSDVEDNVKPETKHIEVQRKGKKRKLDEYENILEFQHKQFIDYRNATIQKWNDKTRVAGGNISSRNFSTFEQSTLKQIEQILSNRHRLIQRTRLKRCVYNILGQELCPQEEGSTMLPAAEPGSQKQEDKLKEYDSEIYDDSDFYHQLLRELIERKSADVTDPVQLGRQWIEIQKLRSKMKRKIDVKATKGRRVRYVVHPKLVNFMAPISESPWNEEAKSELYNSLFGSNKKQYNKL